MPTKIGGIEDVQLTTQFSSLHKVIDFVLALDNLEKYMQERGIAITSNVIPNDEALKIYQRLDSLESSVNTMKARPFNEDTYIANQIGQFKDDITNLKHSLDTKVSVETGALKEQLSALLTKVNAITQATLMTDKDKQDILDTFNGLKNNVFSQLSHSHQTLLSLINSKMVKPSMKWVEVDKSSVTENDIIKVRYTSEIKSGHDYTQKDTNDARVVLYSVQSDSSPELDIRRFSIDGKEFPLDDPEIIKVWKLTI